MSYYCRLCSLFCLLLCYSCSYHSFCHVFLATFGFLTPCIISICCSPNTDVQLPIILSWYYRSNSSLTGCLRLSICQAWWCYSLILFLFSDFASYTFALSPSVDLSTALSSSPFCVRPTLSLRIVISLSNFHFM